MIHKVIITLLLAALGATAQAGPMTLIEEAAEFDRLDARVSRTGSGVVRIVPCDDCAQLTLKLTAATTLEIDGEPRPLETLNRKAVRDGTVFFDADSRRVLRIVAYR